jgi:hypothetical protein
MASKLLTIAGNIGDGSTVINDVRVGWLQAV